MAEPQPSQADEQLDPAAERVRRKLVRFMAINLGILFVALMAVVIAVVYRAFLSDGPSEPQVVTEIPVPPQGSMLTGEIALPEGARVNSHALSGNRLTFDIEVDGQRSILVYDMGEGRTIGRFTLTGTR